MSDDAPLKTVRELLPDFYKMNEGTSMNKILNTVWDREVDGVIEANESVISFLECYQAWINTFIKERKFIIENIKTHYPNYK